MISERRNHYILDLRTPDIQDLELLMNNSAFLWGKSIFTTALLRDDLLSFYDDHLERLKNSAAWLWGEPSLSKILELWNGSWKKLKEQSFLGKGCWRVRFTFFEDLNKEIHSLLALYPFKEEEGAKGVELNLSLMPIRYQGRVDNLKLGSYLDTFREQDRGSGLPLFYNEEGRILETSISNILFYSKSRDKFIYPYEEGQMLLGIGLRKGLEGLDLERSHISKDEINSFESAFVINSLRGPQPVLNLNGQKLREDTLLFERVLSQFKKNQLKYSKTI